MKWYSFECNIKKKHKTRTTISKAEREREIYKLAMRDKNKCVIKPIKLDWFSKTNTCYHFNF